ncbi:unnamed protein product, partial [Ectocarpus sp. 12 AP-2014]
MRLLVRPVPSPAPRRRGKAPSPSSPATSGSPRQNWLMLHSITSSTSSIRIAHRSGIWPRKWSSPCRRSSPSRGLWTWPTPPAGIFGTWPAVSSLGCTRPTPTPLLLWCILAAAG